MTVIVIYVGIERPYFEKENVFMSHAWLLKMHNILLWNVVHFKHIEISVLMNYMTFCSTDSSHLCKFGPNFSHV